MAEGTKIEWTHRPGTIPATMNALVGCQKVSQGCAHCYAIEVAHIRAANPLPVMQHKFGETTRSEGGKRVWTGSVTLTDKALFEPLTKKAPRTYFVNALSDLFYEGVPEEWIDKHFAVFALCPQHTFIVLTKRPERMKDYCAHATKRHIALRLCEMVDSGSVAATAAVTATSVALDNWPLPNVWLGVSVESQEVLNKRAWVLLQTLAAVRFLSCEPLLGPLDLHAGELICKTWRKGWTVGTYLDWVICGGESGPGARPMHPEWARGLRDQCLAANVPFFFKQWGDLAPGAQGADYSKAKDVAIRIAMDGQVVSNPQEFSASDGLFYRVGKKAAGALLDGKQWHQFPEVSA